MLYWLKRLLIIIKRKIGITTRQKETSRFANNSGFEQNEALQLFQQLNIDLQYTQRQYSDLLKKWNALVDQINAKGGREFLLHGTLFRSRTHSPFSQKELITLISLCHPDKHSQSEKAKVMTQKLLSLRR